MCVYSSYLNVLLPQRVKVFLPSFAQSSLKIHVGIIGNSQVQGRLDKGFQPLSLCCADGRKLRFCTGF